jgi:hypothetical protein
VSAAGFDRSSNDRGHWESVGLHGTRRQKEIRWIVPPLQRTGDA